MDPNDKTGPSGHGVLQYLSGLDTTPYLVSFENVSSATAPAQAVKITDVLDSNLDLTTLNLGPLTFAGRVVSPPLVPLSISPFTTTVDLRPATNLLVQVTAALNLSTLTWTLQSLDPATNQPPANPVAGLLPPGAEGSVFLTVMPKSNLTTGTVISNTATVVFDTNAPINTPTWSNTIDNTSPTSMVSPLPATQISRVFPVQWSGSDVGAGIQDFTIYVSDSGAPFAPWLTNTTATQATYAGVPGHTYGFYSIARDLVGNVEPAKSAAEATTSVVQVTTLTITNYQLLSTQPAAGNKVSQTYRADLVNPTSALGSVTATLTSLDPFDIRVAPGQGTLTFTPVPANSQVTSTNTFAIIVDPTVPLDFSKLQWAFQSTPAPPAANPGPNQTVNVGSVVTLDGSGSTNPSGVGALTYSWMFTSRPPGSSSVLKFDTSATPTFVADVAGDYVIALTVSNGTASSTASVTITAGVQGAI